MQSGRMIVAVVLIDSRGRILMQHRDKKAEIYYADTWTVPGGAVDEGESLAEAAQREFLEETGYRLESFSALMSGDHRLPDGIMERRNFFWGVYDGIQEVQCYEGQALRFVSDREFPTMRIVPGLEEVIGKALREWAAGSESGSPGADQ